jgi:phosphatidylglycerophosphate synthase
MRKINPEYENSFDNILIDISEKVAPAFRRANFTPNDITSLSNISMCITILLLLQLKYYWAGLFLILSYFFDCLDGYFARTYNQVSTFGDKYDHFSDIIKNVLFIFVLLMLNPTKFMYVLPIIIIFFMLTMVHLGCQELLYNKDESGTLSLNKYICPVSDRTNLEKIREQLLKTKYFGCGTYYLMLVLVLVYFAQP